MINCSVGSYHSVPVLHLVIVPVLHLVILYVASVPLKKLSTNVPVPHLIIAGSRQFPAEKSHLFLLDNISPLYLMIGPTLMVCTFKQDSIQHQFNMLWVA